MSKDIFSNNPNLDLYYKTSDDTAFFTRNSAENHAKTLEDKFVKKVTRTSEKFGELNINAISGKDEAKEVKAEINKTEKKVTQTSLPVQEQTGASADQIVKGVENPVAEANTAVQEQPEPLSDQVKNNVDTDPAASQDRKIEDIAAEYNQAVSEYMAKFGEVPFEGAELNKIKWALQFNKKLAKL